MNAIGSTGSITLLTALPGSGKSLRMVQWIDEANKRGERVYVTNLNGLKLPHLEFPDPTKWEDLPAGSVLVVDEAQDFFPAVSRKGGEPDYIRNMSKIRHAGIRLILATQQPDYLHSYVLGLVGLHEHLLRLNGQEASTIFRKNEIMERVRSKSARKEYDNERWDFPKQYYDSYTSAQVHTVKYVMPAKTKRGIMMLTAAAVLLGYLVWSTWRDTAKPALDAARGKASASASATTPSADGAASTPAGGAGAVVKHVATPAEYIESLTPRIAALPYSAPIFDQRQARSDPRLFCMEAGAGLGDDGVMYEAECKCVTEQGTKYDLSDAQCHKFAKDGPPYNPFMQSTVEKESGVKMRGQETLGATGAVASPSSMIFGDGGAVPAASPLPPPVGTPKL